MPDRTLLKVGDRIRLLRVPDGDLEQRERELRAGAEQAGWTADAIERIMAQNPVVSVSTPDEYGPWFECDLPGPDGRAEHHSLLIMEDESRQVD